MLVAKRRPFFAQPSPDHEGPTQPCECVTLECVTLDLNATRRANRQKHSPPCCTALRRTATPGRAPKRRRGWDRSEVRMM